MLFINNVKLRNFKSFRYAAIPLNKGFVCLAGPNGSGKSNIIDSLRFILGESSLKALRAKKTSELITVGSKYAEITLAFSGDGKYEIKRAINQDGTTIYRLNGKRTTRMDLLDIMRRHGIYGGDHNVIAQGQVQRIIEMSQKERRELIDTVAGISEFEDKKKESLKELEKVEQKINDARIVLKEREGFLTELEKDRDDALKYIELRDKSKQYKATLLSSEIKRLDSDYAKTIAKLTDLKGKEDEVKKATQELEEQIQKLEQEKHEIVKKINEKSEREKSGLLQETEELKSAVTIARSSAEDKKKESERLHSKLISLETEKKSIEKQKAELSGSLKGLQSEAAELQKTIAELTKKKSSALEKAEQLNTHFLNVRKKTAGLNSLIEDKREELRAAEVQIDKLSNQHQFLEDQLSAMAGSSSTPAQSRAAELEKEIESIKEEMRAISVETDKLFDDEKLLNRKLPEIEKQHLEAKEKYVALATSLKGFSASPEQKAIEAILELRERGMLKGIEGTVGELCEYDDKYAAAVEASAGGRLNFVIVESADVAQKAIEYLKNRKIGRCTFIPLDKKPFVYSAQSRSLSKSKDADGFLIESVEFKPKYAAAYEYVFGDTLLVKDINAGRKIGLGEIRMATYEGDLLEASGVMTGGQFSRRPSPVSERAKLDKLSKEADSLKQEKDGIMQALQNLREELNRKRHERTELEVKCKGFEIELNHMLESDKARSEAEKTRAEKIKDLNSKLAETEKQAKQSAETKTAIENQLAKLRSELAELSTQLDYETENKEKQNLGEAEKQLFELQKNHAEIESRIASLKAEEKILLQRSLTTSSEHGEISTAIKTIESEIRELLKGADAKEALLQKNMEKLKSVGGELEKFYAQRTELETRIDELAKQKGSRSHGFEKYLKELSELEVKKATIETRLADLKTEFESYKEIKTVEDMGKRELDEAIKAIDASILALGEVNLKAPEIYEQKSNDIKEVKEKITLLSDEKGAVVAMIEEIDTKKKAIFMETFQALSENFKKLYSYIFKGEGSLSLENPSDPFESGLLIKVKDEKKDERYLEAMSGGEKTLLALLFVFSIQMYKPAPFYVLDEADAALDKENSKKLSQLLQELAKNTQFIVVTHNDTILSSADIALGVTMTPDGSKVVGVELKGKKNAPEPQAEPAQIIETTIATQTLSPPSQ